MKKGLVFILGLITGVILTAITLFVISKEYSKEKGPVLRPHPTKYVNVRVAAVRQIPSCRLRSIAGYVTEPKGGRWRAAARQR